MNKKVLIPAVAVLLLLALASNIQAGEPAPTFEESGSGRFFAPLNLYFERNGVVKVTNKSNETISSIGFIVKGTVGGENYIKKVTDYNWSWEQDINADGFPVNSYTGRNNNAVLDWNQTYNQDLNGKLGAKITQSIKAVASVQNAKMFFVITLPNNLKVRYNQQEYNLGEIGNRHFTEDLNVILPQVEIQALEKYVFSFKDIIDSGYNVSDLYIDDGTGVDIGLPVLTGSKYLAVGIGPYNLQAGKTYTFDPIFSLDQNLIGLYWGGLALGDIDKNGSLDLITTGQKLDNNVFTLVYTNSGGNFTRDQNLVGLERGATAFGDLDNDGDLDLIASGEHLDGNTFTLVYKNSAGTFALDQNLVGLSYGGISLGDLDNDGDLDAVITGENKATANFCLVYKNNGTGTLTLDQNLTKLDSGGIALGDVDNDGDLDLVHSGQGVGGSGYTLVYTNNGTGAFALDQNLVGLYLGGVALGDIDNDGDLDLINNGRKQDGNFFMLVYTNSGGDFTRDQNLVGLNNGGLALGDVDNDGDLDLAASGQDQALAPFSLLYLNNAGTFALDQNLTGGRYGGIAFGDVDSDNDLDVVITGISSNVARAVIATSNQADTNQDPNTAPSPPTAGFSTTYSGNRFRLIWGDGSDANTAANGLYYNIKVGTTADANNLISPYYGGQGGFEQGHNGMFGNMMQRQDLNLVIANQTIYWAVQAIDPSLKASAWSATQTNATGDSCTCPASGNWNIVNSDACTLSTTCNLAGDLHISSGSLRITSTGVLSVPAAKKIVIENGQRMSIDPGGKIIVD